MPGRRMVGEPLMIWRWIDYIWKLPADILTSLPHVQVTGEISLTSKKNLLRSDCLGEVNILELLLIHDTMCKVASKKN